MNAYAGDAAMVVIVMWGIIAGVASGVSMFRGVSQGINGNAKGDPAKAAMGFLFGLVAMLGAGTGFVVVSIILIKIISEIMMLASQIP